MTKQSPKTAFHVSPYVSPFDNTRDVRFFYESAGHAEALSRMTYLVQDKTMGIGLLTGEIGCGKTLTRTVLANRLDPAEFKVVAIENGLLGFDDLLLEVISQIRGERVHSSQYPDRYSRMAEYKRLLVSFCSQRGQHLVIIIDEAQQLEDHTLEALKGLTNISGERLNFATLVLVGQPELRERIKAWPQIDQRVSLRFHLNPISLGESVRYLAHRLKVAGIEGRLPFDREAIKQITRHAQGIPRNINRLCKLSLDYAQSRKIQRVDTTLIDLVLRDLDEQSVGAFSVVGLG